MPWAIIHSQIFIEHLLGADTALEIKIVYKKDKVCSHGAHSFLEGDIFVLSPVSGDEKYYNEK